MKEVKEKEVKILKFQPGYAEEVSKVVRDTFSKFNYNECTPEAFEMYLAHHDFKRNPKKYLENKKRLNIVLVAKVDDKVMGYVGGMKWRIGNLYVLGQYHGKGIGKKLLIEFEKAAKALGSNEIRIRASLYATGFYQSQGYKKTTGIRNMKGIKFQPMKKVLTG